VVVVVAGAVVVVVAGEVVVVDATVVVVVLVLVAEVVVVVPDSPSPAQATARTLITMNSRILRGDPMASSQRRSRVRRFRQVPVKSGLRLSKKAVMASVRSFEMR
jgi:hypothetical protein